MNFIESDTLPSELRNCVTNRNFKKRKLLFIQDNYESSSFAIASDKIKLAQKKITIERSFQQIAAQLDFTSETVAYTLVTLTREELINCCINHLNLQTSPVNKLSLNYS